MSSKLNIDKFRNDYGGFTGEDGCYYKEEVAFYHIGIFGFCWCGNPKENLAFIRDGLRYVKMGKYDVNELAMQFFFYWADTAGLIDHSLMLPGWLTKKGEEVLEDLLQMDLE